MVEFIKGKIVCTVKESKELISADERNNKTNYKFTFSVEIAPICKDDLVIIPKSLSKELGGIGPLCLIYKITTSVHIVDCITMKTFEIDPVTYWKNQFGPLCAKDRLSQFSVISINDSDFTCNTSMSRAAMKQNFNMMEVEIRKDTDLGLNDQTHIVKTHLGNKLTYNDSIYGYDLA
jgi:nonsense-mediated mRNA decay protein 3